MPITTMETTMDTIQLNHTHEGFEHPYYVNVNQFTKGSITCYFDKFGKLSATTLRTQSAKQNELLQKVTSYIDGCNVIIPQPK